MASHAHSHASGPGTAPDHRTTRALQIALAANAAFLVVQLLAGIAFDSLALIADSAHMGADVGALALVLVARRLSSRPASTRNTYGMLRAEVLAAQANALALVLVSGWVIFEAVQRLADPPAVDGLGVLVVGCLGLVVNAGSAWLIARSGDRSLNVRGAFLHLAADAAGSLGVIIAGAVVLATGEDWIDPAISLVITALVLVAAFGLLRDATVVLLEGVPKGIDVNTIEGSLLAFDGVDAVHHLHVWAIGSETPALSAHVVLSGERTLHDAQLSGDALKAMLAERFGIEHSTLELECHACDDEGHDAQRSAARGGSGRAGRVEAPD